MPKPNFKSRNHEHYLELAEEQALTHKQQGSLARSLKRQVQNGTEVQDDTFDLMYSPEVRKFSGIHFTPLEVALKASEIMDEMKSERVLDVGSGSGKFCIVTGMKSPKLHVTGVEQREFLSTAARKAKNAFELPQVSFISGSAFDFSWKDFDCIYFYNPFCEQKVPERRMRNDIPMNESLYNTYVQKSHSRLREQKKGTKVMTYHGFGGAMPEEYSLYYQKAVCSDFLRVWVRD